jgi:predicted MFS family arabinose efflux permease
MRPAGPARPDRSLHLLLSATNFALGLPVLLAMHSGALYAGAWAGSTLGGQVLESGSSQWLGPAGALLTVIALISLTLVHGPVRKPA